MHPRPLTALLLASTLACAACSASPKEAPSREETSSATAGVMSVMLLSADNLLQETAGRPAAVLGVYATHFLAGNATVRATSALGGIAAQLQLYLGQTADRDTSAAVIEQLGTTLEVDIADMLNRSTDRSKALDQYLAFLEGAMTEAQAVHERLAATRKELDTKLSAQRKETSALKREVDKAVKEKNFSLAGAKQELLGLAEADLAALTTERGQVVTTADLLGELLTIADERLAAITHNRDALLAGVTVTDLPGVSDLGILTKGSRKR